MVYQRLFEIKLEITFISKTVSKFWSRWHMPFDAWIKNYAFYSVTFLNLYMALNRKVNGKVKALPTLCARLVFGLWHGAIKYIIYELYYFVIMMIGI